MEEDIKKVAALASLNHMFKEGYLSVCTIDKVAVLLNVDPRGEAYNVLQALHCVYFSEMPDHLKREIPALIRQCLNVDTIFRFETLDREVIEISEKKPGRFMKLISGRRS